MAHLSWFPFHRQVRGKKKIAQPTTIKVKLLQDIKGYGKKGSITPVARGRMRNTWYPRQKAEYITTSSLPGTKLKDVVAERDFTFGMQPKEDSTPEMGKILEKERAVEVQTKLLPPQRASEIIESSLPPNIVFFRAPISNLEPEAPTQEAPSQMRRAASPAAAELEAASEPLLKPSKPPKPQLATIYGSVSTTEIAESIRALLAETREGARVVLAAEDVTLLQEEDVEEGSQNQDHGIEGDRLKALGDFRVQVRVKGGEPVFRTVRVIAPEVDPQLEIERSRQRVL